MQKNQQRRKSLIGPFEKRVWPIFSLTPCSMRGVEEAHELRCGISHHEKRARRLLHIITGAGTACNSWAWKLKWSEECFGKFLKPNEAGATLLETVAWYLYNSSNVHGCYFSLRRQQAVEKRSTIKVCFGCNDRRQLFPITTAPDVCRELCRLYDTKYNEQHNISPMGGSKLFPQLEAATGTPLSRSRVHGPATLCQDASQFLGTLDT